MWILTVAYTAHILEEYMLDWRGWTQKISGIALGWTDFFAANFAVIIFGISCSVVGFDAPWFSYMFVGLASVNAVAAHIGTSVVKRVFSPGLITSVFLFVPVSVWAYFTAWQKGVMTLPFMVATIGGGSLIMAFPIMLHFLRRRIKF